MRHYRFLLILLVFLCSLALTAQVRYNVIEDFETGTVELNSWADEDQQPDAWSIDSTVTHNASAFSLRLDGNCWKQQSITPLTLSSNSVIQLAVRHSYGAAAQGIGFSDGTNHLYYSFSGSQTLDIEEWIPVYQGALSSGVWNDYQLPVGADWEAFFGYLPAIDTVIYINDLSYPVTRSIWFDTILDITEDLPASPQVTILYGGIIPPLNRFVSVELLAYVVDPDSDSFSYFWDFGDGTTSNEQNPTHTFYIQDNHDYTVNLRVVDDTGRWGFASTQITPDAGPSSLPLTLNFVGDVMLARRYEQGNGIIPTQGVNAIFIPTLPLLGAAADISVANLEVVLANVGSPHPTKSVVYRGNPQNVSGLSFAGIDIVSLANNHTLDYGLPALQQTQGLLNDAGILYSGAGANSYEAYLPAFINKKGLNLAFLRNSDRTGQYNNAQPYLQAGYNKEGFAYMTPYYIEQQIQAVQDVADLKIVEMHGGSEYSTAPGSGYDKNNPFWGDDQDEDYAYRTDVPHQWDIDIRHSAIDSGADLVIVHHPHIIQGLEVYNGKLIAHSLGNFAFDLDYPECFPSMILYADAYEDGFQNYRVRPVYIDDYIPKPSRGKLGIYTLDYLAMKSRELGTTVVVDKQEMVARVILDTLALQQYPNHWSSTDDLGDYQNGYQYTKPVKLPRFGSISSIDSVEPVGSAEHSLGTELIWFGNMEDEGSSLWSIPAFSNDAVEGVRSALLESNSDQQTATISRKMKLYDNTKRYSLHGYIKTATAETANITIRYYSSRTSYSPISTEDVTPSLSGTTPWTLYFKELSVPSNAWYYDIRLQLSNSAGEPAQAWFDEVGLIEWTGWQSSESLAHIAYPNNYYWLQTRCPEDAKSITTYLTETLQQEHVLRSNSTASSRLIPLKVYPNPFNPQTNLAFNLSQAGKTELKIYNIKGQVVRHLLNDELGMGEHRLMWNSRDDRGRQLSSGIYFVRINCGNYHNTQKLILLK